MAATIAVLKVISGAALVAIGLGLIGICHLRISFWGRAGLLGAIAAALALFRAQSEPFSALDGMWAILGSMFIFRIMLYLYDLKHRTAPFSPALGHLVLLHAAQRLLSPLSGCRLQDILHSRISTTMCCGLIRRALSWMFRGIVQLLLYRLDLSFRAARTSPM